MIKEIKTFVGGPKALPAGGNSIVADTDIGKASAAVDAEKAAVEATQEPTNTPLSNQIAKSAATPATGITNQDLFPGMNQNINVGSSSSKTLGSQPIFVAAGQYVPYNILNKKEEAIAAAAKKRAERQAKFDPGKAGKLNNQLYQRKLNDRFNKMNSDFIRTAQSMDPDNWDVMLNDPGSEIGRAYAQQKSNYEVLATESNVIFDKAAAVMAAQESGGDTIYSEATKNLASQVDHMTGSAAEGGLENLRPFVDKLNGSFDLDKHLANNKVVAQMKADITSLLTPEHGGLTVEEVSDWSKRIEAYAESETANSAGRYHKDNIIKKQDIVDRLSSMLGVSKTIKHKYEPKISTYDKKKGVEKEDAQDRFEKVEYIRENPYSEEAITALGGMIGNQWGKGKVLEIDYSHPEDFIKYDDAADGIINEWEVSKDKITGNFGTWNQSEIETKGKEAVIGALKELGKGSNQVSSVKKGDGSNIIIETGTEKVTIDLGSEDSGKEALSKFLVKYGKEKEAVGTRSGSKVRVVTLDGKRKVTEYVDLLDPRLFKLTNASLNTGKAENLKIKQKDIDKLLKAKRAKQAGKKPIKGKKVSFADYQKTGEYKDKYDKWKKSNPNASDEAINAEIEKRRK